MENPDVEETTRKQEFLRSEILDKNYDPNEFISFLKAAKGEEGGELDNWTLEDLTIVSRFI